MAELAWWACWASYDFSVQGLKSRFGNRLINRMVGAGLQEISDEYGNKWLEGFAPLVDADGTPIAPPQTSGFVSAIRFFERFDQRELTGIVVPSDCRFSTLAPFTRSSIKWAHFGGRIQLDEVTNMELESCFVGGAIECRGVRKERLVLNNCFADSLTLALAKNAQFNMKSCYFLEGISIKGFRFSSSAEIGTNFVCGDLKFEECNLQEQRAILPKHYGGRLDCHLVQDGTAIVQPVANVSIDFRDASNITLHIPDKTTLGELNISGSKIAVHFCRGTAQDGVKFSPSGNSERSSLDLSETKFMAALSIALPLQQLKMQSSEVLGNFDLRQLSGGWPELILDGSLFHSSVKCHPSQWKVISAKKCWFHKLATFVDVGAVDATSFRGARFLGPFKFGQSNEALPAGRLDFSEAVFEADASFHGRHFHASTDFGRTIWGGVPDFHQAELHPDTSFVSARFDVPSLKKRMSNLQGDKREQDLLMGRYERAFRSLKLKAEALRANSVESMFHRLEMVAKREISSTPRFEKIFSLTYDAFSLYGESFVRPALVWLGQVTVLGLVYWTLLAPHWLVSRALGVSLDQSDVGRLADALVLSFTNSIRPFYTTGASFDRMVSMGPTVGPTSDYWSFIQQMLVSYPSLARWLLFGQNVIGLVLIFLFVMAVRRRFQIS
ncbi:MAG: pentapeptide repeat-containing protein [Pseudomonadota bacterium]|nr:pentapeptide repeat-containing protein [Pseudomonadota bacterium]